MLLSPFKIIWELIEFGLQALFVYVLAIIIFIGILFIVLKDNKATNNTTTIDTTKKFCPLFKYKSLLILKLVKLLMFFIMYKASSILLALKNNHAKLTNIKTIKTLNEL